MFFALPLRRFYILKQKLVFPTYVQILEKILITKTHPPFYVDQPQQLLLFALFIRLEEK